MTITPQQSISSTNTVAPIINTLTLQALPRELQVRIAQHLPTPSLWALTSSAKALSHLAQRPELYRPRLEAYAAADQLGAEDIAQVRRFGVTAFDSPVGQTFQREVHQRFGSLVLAPAAAVVGVVECLARRSLTAPIALACATGAAILWHPYAVPLAILGLAWRNGSVLTWPSAAALGLGLDLRCHGPTRWTRWRAAKEQPVTAADAWDRENLQTIKQALEAPDGVTISTHRKALAVTVALQSSLSRTLQHLSSINDVETIGKILGRVDDGTLRLAMKTYVEFHLNVLHEATVKPIAKLAGARREALLEALRRLVSIAEVVLAAVNLSQQEAAQLDWQAEEVHPALAVLLTPGDFPHLHRHFGWAACRLFTSGTPESVASATRLVKWLSRPDLVRDTDGRPVRQIIEQLSQNNLACQDANMELDGDLAALQEHIRIIEQDAERPPDQNGRDHQALALPPP